MARLEDSPDVRVRLGQVSVSCTWYTTTRRMKRACEQWCCTQEATMSRQTLGQMIQAGRRRQGLTQEQFADRLAHSKGWLVPIENNRATPPLDVLLNIFTAATQGESGSDLRQWIAAWIEAQVAELGPQEPGTPVQRTLQDVVDSAYGPSISSRKPPPVAGRT